MPIRGSSLKHAPPEIVGPCRGHLDDETRELADRIWQDWDPLKFFELLAGCNAGIQEKCFGAIVTELSTMSGADGFGHIKDTLLKGKPNSIIILIVLT